ncbi:MAG: hypothetical protein AB7E09_07525 [Candidatus Izemoplasmatales bacterium]
MKNIILSADSKPCVYLVPDIVAENLREYCLEFLSALYDFENDREFEIIDDVHVESNHEMTLSYDETAFIYWLNKIKFPNETSTYVETLDCEAYDGIKPEIYKSCPWFNF